jgi:hypothetical protein
MAGIHGVDIKSLQFVDADVRGHRVIYDKVEGWLVCVIEQITTKLSVPKHVPVFGHPGIVLVHGDSCPKLFAEVGSIADVVEIAVCQNDEEDIARVSFDEVTVYAARFVR